MSLPFRIGDIVEIDEEKIFIEPALEEFVGERGTVKTMGVSWVKVAFESCSRSFVISNDKVKRVKDEDARRF
tara:strand:+ start:1507 stop:1722 length:216 start_codon:yes stop_codon:yes gene_type:complete